MYIAHGNGNPLIVKTTRGNHWVAFASVADGQMYLRWKELSAALGTLDEILRLNPRAFPRQFLVLHLASREVIESLLRHPHKFEVEEHLVTLTQPADPEPAKPAPILAPVRDQPRPVRKSSFPSLIERVVASVSRRLRC